MNFREIKIGELPEFIASDFYKSSAVIPISPQRAISQSKNPNSNNNDVALILALDDKEEIIGYIGILPGKISLESSPYYWNSCWWVDPEKGKMAAMPLFYKMLQLSNQKMIFFELTDTTKNIVAKFKFKTEIIPGCKYFLLFNFAQILSKRNGFFKTIKPLLSFSDWFLNCFISLKLSRFKKDTSIKYEQIDSINDEADNFIQQFSKTQLIPITKDEVNWIVEYPWIKTQPNSVDQQIAKRYFFSSISKSFSNNLYKVYKDEKLVAVLFFTIRDKEMKLPYAFFNTADTNTVAKAIYQIAINKLVTSFTCFNKQLRDELNTTKNPFTFTKPLKKNIAYPIDLNFDGKTIQDGDGDAVFC
jgi:hypothetical protein